MPLEHSASAREDARESTPSHVLKAAEIERRVRGYCDRLRGVLPVECDAPDQPTSPGDIREVCLQELHGIMPVKNVGQLLSRIAKEYGDLTAVVGVRLEAGEIVEDGTLSYRELLEAVKESVATLGNAGVRAGHKVVILSENRMCGLVMLLACLSMGAIVVPWTEKKVESCMTRKEVITRTHANFVVDCSRGTPVIIPANDSHAETTVEHRDIALNDPAMEMFTTGTGGDQPSLVSFTHANILFPAVVAPGVFAQPAGATALHGMPCYHIYGFEVVLTLLSGGAKIVLCNGRDLISGGEKMVKRYKPRFMANVPLGWKKTVEEFEAEFSRTEEGGGIRAWVLRTFIRPALVEAQVQVAEEDIRLCERMGLPSDLLECVREYWAPVLTLKDAIDSSLSARLKRSIGRRLFRRVREESGLDLGRGRGIGISGAGELPSTILSFLLALGFDVRNGYGLTQSAAITGIPNPLGRQPARFAGQVLHGMAAWTERHPTEDVDEICIAGPSVAQDPGGSTTQGVLRTGDRGRVIEVNDPTILREMGSEGYRLYLILIEDRLKEMAKQNGNSILLNPLKKALEGGLIREAMIVQNSATERFGVLVQIDENLVRSCMGDTNHPHKPVDYRDPRVRALVAEEIRNRSAAACAAQRTSIEYFAIVEFTDPLEEQDEEFPPDEKMRTMKGELKRSFVQKRLRKDIDDMWLQGSVMENA